MTYNSVTGSNEPTRPSETMRPLKGDSNENQTL